MKKLLLCLLLASCYGPRMINQTGWYEVEEAKGFKVKFKGYDTFITLPVDTMKKGDKVHMTKLNRYGKG